MLITVCIACIPDARSGQSECSLLLELLLNNKAAIEHERDRYGTRADGLIEQIDSIADAIHRAMLNALENLDPIVIPDKKGGYQDAYVERLTPGQAVITKEGEIQP